MNSIRKIISALFSKQVGHEICGNEGLSVTLQTMRAHNLV